MTALATARKAYEDRMMKSVERYFKLLHLSTNDTIKAMNSDQNECQRSENEWTYRSTEAQAQKEEIG
jgi:hypothetical protein